MKQCSVFNWVYRSSKSKSSPELLSEIFRHEAMRVNGTVSYLKLVVNYIEGVDNIANQKNASQINIIIGCRPRCIIYVMTYM